MALLGQGKVADAFVVGVGTEVRLVRDVIKVFDLVSVRHLPAPGQQPAQLYSSVEVDNVL